VGAVDRSKRIADLTKRRADERPGG